MPANNGETAWTRTNQTFHAFTLLQITATATNDVTTNTAPLTKATEPLTDTIAATTSTTAAKITSTAGTTAPQRDATISTATTTDASTDATTTTVTTTAPPTITTTAGKTPAATKPAKMTTVASEIVTGVSEINLDAAVAGQAAIGGAGAATTDATGTGAVSVSLGMVAGLVGAAVLIALLAVGIVVKRRATGSAAASKEMGRRSRSSRCGSKIGDYESLQEDNSYGLATAGSADGEPCYGLAVGAASGMHYNIAGIGEDLYEEAHPASQHEYADSANVDAIYEEAREAALRGTGADYMSPHDYAAIATLRRGPNMYNIGAHNPTAEYDDVGDREVAYNPGAAYYNVSAAPADEMDIEATYSQAALGGDADAIYAQAGPDAVVDEVDYEHASAAVVAEEALYDQAASDSGNPAALYTAPRQQRRQRLATVYATSAAATAKAHAAARAELMQEEALYDSATPNAAGIEADEPLYDTATNLNEDDVNGGYVNAQDLRVDSEPIYDTAHAGATAEAEPLYCVGSATDSPKALYSKGSIRLGRAMPVYDQGSALRGDEEAIYDTAADCSDL